MRAFTLDAFGAQPALRDDSPEPHAGDNELVVRIHASSVNPVDVFIAAGALKEMVEHEFPVTLGRGYAGVVDDGRVASPLGAAGDGPGRTNLVASPSTSNLERLGALLEAGDLRVVIQNTYSLEQAGEALDSLRNEHTQGKLAIEILDV